MAGTTPEDAGAALAAVRRAQQAVAAEVGLPRLYWWGLGAGWVVLGVIAELDVTWLTSVATLAFGAGHAAIASRLLDGRSRTRDVRVSAAVAGRRTPAAVVLMLLVMVAVTVAAALLLNADGAGHPTTAAGIFVGLLVALGGPEMLRVSRRIVRA